MALAGFPTTVFNRIGEQRVLKDQAAFNALEPGWFESPDCLPHQQVKPNDPAAEPEPAPEPAAKPSKKWRGT